MIQIGTENSLFWGIKNGNTLPRFVRVGGLDHYSFPDTKGRIYTNVNSTDYYVIGANMGGEVHFSYWSVAPASITQFGITECVTIPTSVTEFDNGSHAGSRPVTATQVNGSFTYNGQTINMYGFAANTACKVKIYVFREAHRIHGNEPIKIGCVLPNGTLTNATASVLRTSYGRMETITVSNVKAVTLPIYTYLHSNASGGTDRIYMWYCFEA